ncbi:hypothetical protein [Paenibacillus sp. MSJ-34]|uniref:hypothetical protein n=1 Tax=Paenibacillus sp. MSJ-34 TaxID=2841529 RepID=UPI001C10557D|nr:hypothetical protein [Paenibacillus sp. MSJ-34]MBU5445587.1 hypothetical protein [Paenibacillus sp. MSJ-34]
MAKVLKFPQPNLQQNKGQAFDHAMLAIEQRLGVTFWDYVGIGGKRTDEVQATIDRALHKETLQMATNSIEK